MAPGALDAAVLARPEECAGQCCHADLSQWALRVGYDVEDVDRWLVLAHRSAAVEIDLRDPPSSANRMIRLVRASRTRL